MHVYTPINVNPVGWQIKRILTNLNFDCQNPFPPYPFYCQSPTPIPIPTLKACLYNLLYQNHIRKHHCKTYQRSMGWEPCQNPNGDVKIPWFTWGCQNPLVCLGFHTDVPFCWQLNICFDVILYICYKRNTYGCQSMYIPLSKMRKNYAIKEPLRHHYWGGGF